MRLADAASRQPWRRWASRSACRWPRWRPTSHASPRCSTSSHSWLRPRAIESDLCGGPSRRSCASIAGDWPEARQAVAAVQAAGEDAHFDPTAARLEAFALSSVIDLFEGMRPSFTPLAIEWPQPSMGFVVRAYHAFGLVRQRRRRAAAKALTEIVPADLFDLERDAYWFRQWACSLTLRSCRQSRDSRGTRRARPRRAAAHHRRRGRPLPGSVAHAAGLASATCDRRSEAASLLAEAAAIHDRQGSRWMAAESRAVLEVLR